MRDRHRSRQRTREPITDYAEQQRRLLATIRRDVRAADRASRVPIVADHAGAPGRTLTIVAFPPRHVLDVIRTQVQAPLQHMAPQHYYYPQASMHITIKNVRKTANPPRFDAQTIVDVATLLHDCCRQCHGVAFSFSDVIAFPTSISVIGYSSADLQALVQTLDRTLVEAGLPDDKQYLSDAIFFGNITVCRFTEPPSAELLAAASDLALTPPSEVVVDTLTLVSCNAAAAPATMARHADIVLAP